jgi:hypothetical protein
VLLGAHSLSRPEPFKRLYDVLREVPHPDSQPATIDHDLLLLQVRRPAVSLSLSWKSRLFSAPACTLIPSSHYLSCSTPACVPTPNLAAALCFTAPLPAPAPRF